MTAERERLQHQGKRLAFTNGCFDVLHRGHVEYLTFARRQADALVVGLNSDASVRRLKGAGRPVNPQEDRAAVLLGLRAVDYVVIFEENEPRALIECILPAVLVKGRDWAHHVSGREVVESHGGHIVLANLLPGRSSSRIINAVSEQQHEKNDDHA
jgi:D-beta-D-heptose 7-phosphate kinase/D-beta-D-heptose 1-phosphate adenosyltransferase